MKFLVNVTVPEKGTWFLILDRQDEVAALLRYEAPGFAVRFLGTALEGSIAEVLRYHPTAGQVSVPPPPVYGDPQNGLPDILLFLRSSEIPVFETRGGWFAITRYGILKPVFPDARQMDSSRKVEATLLVADAVAGGPETFQIRQQLAGRPR